MLNSPLIKVFLTDKERKIGIVNYSDAVVLDDDNSIVAIRIGGYPESVQAMLDAIVTGCSIELTGSQTTIKASTKGNKNYEKKLSKNGVYAEGLYYLTDDTPHTFSIGSDEDQEIVKNINLYIFCNNDNELFSQLDKKLSVPLLPEFQDYFLSELKARRILKPLNVYVIGKAFFGWHLSISHDEKGIVKVLEDGLKNKKISIPTASDKNDDIFKGIDSFTAYLNKFGVHIAKRIQKCFPPRYIPDKQPICGALSEVNNHVIKHAGYSLFDAQLQRAEAIKCQLETSNMAILVAECGTGKTKIGSAAVYAYQRSKQKKKAFNVVICPSHIKKKWVRELYQSVPNCYAVCVNNLSEADKLYDYYRKSNTTVFAVLSKETAKNGSTVVLDSSVPTAKREEWVDKRLDEGVKVLIVNPALVETGLDLNAFTTLIFYNLAYNLYIFRQAARRSYRINQTAPKIEVYMFYYAKTMQQRALRLMASKLSAATVIEGNISDEGLAAMSDCEDLTTQLAKELMLGLKENEQDITDTFKSMSIRNERPSGLIKAKEDSMTIIEKAELKPETVILPFNMKTVKTDSRMHDTGQMSLFDLLAS